MKNWCKTKQRRISLYELNRFFKKNYSFEDIFSEEFNLLMKSYSYYDSNQIKGIVQNYMNVVLNEEIINGILITFNDENINSESISLERQVSRSKKFPWILDDFIDDEGLYSHTVLVERLLKLNKFTVPTKNK